LQQGSRILISDNILDHLIFPSKALDHLILQHCHTMRVSEKMCWLVHISHLEFMLI